MEGEKHYFGEDQSGTGRRALGLMEGKRGGGGDDEENRGSCRF